MRAQNALVASLYILLAAPLTLASDWPTYRHDDRRGAMTDDGLEAERLALDWVYRSPLPPNPAWAGAAKWDAYHSKKDLTPMRDYDLAFYPIVVGNRLYYGSSSDDAIHCLDSKTGKQQWAFTSGGPVRIAPSCVAGRLYFGSDDGHGYCIDATTGSLVWRFSPTPDRRMVLNNGRMISTWPVRTGVVVSDETAYFAASLLPWKESYLCAVDAATGKPEGKGRYVNLINSDEGRTFEAAMAANESLLFTPQGRVWLLAYNKATGKRNQDIKVVGAGSFVMITQDGYQAGSGAARTTDVSVANLRKATQILTHGEALSMVVSADLAFLQTAKSVVAVEWKTNKNQWTAEATPLFAHVVAGHVVFAGGRDEVRAFDSATGKLLWRGDVDGDAHGLAVADDALFASTHTGGIYCFRPTAERPAVPSAAESIPADAVAAAQPTPAPPAAKLTTGPYLRFTTAAAAEVRWTTAQPTPTVLEFVEAGKLTSREPRHRVEDATPKLDHVALLTGLRRARDYNYSIWIGPPNDQSATPWHACENLANFELPDVSETPAPFAEDEFATINVQAAKRILSESGVTDGICLVYGVGTGRLAYELATHSKLRVLCVDDDADRVATVRAALQKTNAYGGKVSVLAVPSLVDLPLPDGFANLVVSETMLTKGECVGSAREILRVLRPAGGIALAGLSAKASHRPDRAAFAAWFSSAAPKVDIVEDPQGLWGRYTRGKLPRSGDWTHQYGTPANQAFCGEALAGATTVDDLQLQWLGYPGPRYQPDRQVRKPSPLAANGRLYMEGLERIIAADAYNGTILWSLEVPGMRRFNMPRDASNMCADDNYLYLAVEDKCWKIDGPTGRVVQMLDAVRPTDKTWDVAWGYLANHGDLLYGTATRKGSTFNAYWGNSNWYDSHGGWDTAKVCSDNLFAYDKQQGALRWSYDGGVLMHTAIAMGPGSIYFLESRNGKVNKAEQRIIGDPDLFKDLFLVALDASTGQKQWEQPIAIGSGTVMISLAYGDGKLVLTSSGDRKFWIYTFDASNGSPAWDTTIPWPTDNHGGQLSRPAIVGDTLFVRPKSYNLHTGKPLNDIAWGACGSYACSLNSIFYRSGNITMFTPSTGQNSSWSRLRPDCWISTIPACGMVLSPEGGGGCWCSIWMETSAGFLPASLVVPRFDKTERSFVGFLDFSLATPSRDADIRYTLDGSEPTAQSSLYQGPLRINGDEVVVKSRSFARRAPEEYVSSDVTAALFVRNYPAPDLDYKLSYFARPQAIAFHKQDPDGEIRYTLDGSEPTRDSTLFKQPFTITDTTIVKGATFYPSGRKTATTAKTYSKTEPVALGNKDLVPGLRYKYAEYWGDKVPDFSAIAIKTTGLVDNFDLSPMERKDGCALQFEGYINIPVDGEYKFYLRSDDGSQLRIGDAVVVDNNGVHDANATRSGKVTLKAGPNPIRLDYFELVGGEVIEASYEGPATKRQQIPPSVLYHLAE